MGVAEGRNDGDDDGVNVGTLDGLLVGAVVRPVRIENYISIRIILRTDNLKYHIMKQPA